jgi:SRSO17 transposase
MARASVCTRTIAGRFSLPSLAIGEGFDLDGTMTPDLLRTLLAMVEVFRPALTAPGFDKALVVFVGWVLTSGPHAVTGALVATEVAQRRHHEGFHRFFSRGSWSPDALGELLFQRIASWLPQGYPLQLVVDDTLAPKKGRHVFGIGSHLDAVRSSKRCRIFTFGHVWVVLSVVVRVPFSSRPWALPVLFRLYRNAKECEASRQPYRKKTELAREMVDVFVRWSGQRQIHLAADSAYCNDTVTRGLSNTVTLFGAMRPDAVLTAVPAKRQAGMRGRRPLRGRPLPKPEKLARNQRAPWQTVKALLYGKLQTVHYKTIDAQWYRACGVRLLRIVVVRVDTGRIPLRVFFCTDATLDVVQILETYAGRWATEVCFRDLKQLLGFADSSARKQQAVERTAPFVGYIYTTLVLWFAQYAWKAPVAAPPVRPWYTHKRGASFADVLRAAQRTLKGLDVLDPGSTLANLHESPTPQWPAEIRARKAASRRDARPSLHFPT